MRGRPAWWLLKKKKTMYHTGGADARSVRSKMQFMLTPITPPGDFDKHEPAFRDIEEYLRTIEAPKFPFPIDTGLAAKGERVFRNNCASCHGTYGEKWTYPNKIVPLADIGTDPKRTRGSNRFATPTTSWFAGEDGGRAGYGFMGRRAARPRRSDGIGPRPVSQRRRPTWRRPGLARPRLYPVSTGETDYDKANVG